MPKLSVRALMSALPYRIKQQNDEIMYTIYMSDTLLSFAKGVLQPDNEPRRYCDFVHPQPEETRTAEEIIEHMKNKLREVS